MQSGDVVHVMKRPADVTEEEPGQYTELVKRYDNVRRVLPGEPQEEYPDFVGNSVLLDLGGERYAYVGERVYEFAVAHEAPIERLFSRVGNSDVPYPVALSGADAFFMLDTVTVPRVRFGAFDDWLDGYSHFYQALHSPKQPQFADLVVVHERIL